jgi:heme exporter protein CcmD
VTLFGPHGAYIVAAFAAAGLILGWMIASSVLDYRNARRRLAAVEPTKDRETA